MKKNNQLIKRIMDGEENNAPAPEEKASGSVGPLIGIVIIVVVLVVGGFYYWGESLNNADTSDMTPEEILEQEDPAKEALETQGTSDEVEDIEADLDLTDLEDLDAELEAIEDELAL